AAFEAAKNVSANTTSIEVRTEMGFGAPEARTSAVQGAPRGPEGAETAKKNYDWTHSAFEEQDEVYAQFQESIADKGAKAEKEWEELLEEYVNECPELGKEFKLALAGELPKDWKENLPHYEESQEGSASRESSGEVLNAIAE